MIRIGVDRRLRGQDADPILLGDTLETRAEVHRVAHHGVGHAEFRAHVADAHAPAVDADADLHLGPAARGKFPVQLRQRGLHVERGLHRAGSMIREIHRCVPERHDGVADVFVDGAPVVLDDTRHARQIGIQHFGEFGWRQFFREIGEAADVGEQHRHLARLPFHRVVRRIAAHLVGEFRRHILAEQPGDLTLAARRGKKSVGGVQRIQAEHREHRRRHRYDPEMRPGGRIGRQQQSEHRQARHQTGYRPEAQQHPRQQRTQPQHGEQTRVVGPRRHAASGAVEHAGDQVGVNLDAREGIGKRRHAQVGQPRGGRAHQHDAVFQLGRRHLSRQHLRRRNVGERRTGTIRHIHRAIPAQRHAEAAHLDPRRAV